MIHTQNTCTSFYLPDIELPISAVDQQEVLLQSPRHVADRGGMACGHEQTLPL